VEEAAIQLMAMMEMMVPLQALMEEGHLVMDDL
jgi:hypothetical protein